VGRVGDHSCLTLNACLEGVGEVGDYACLGEKACKGTKGNNKVGDRACIGFDACRNLIEGTEIENDACVGVAACIRLQGKVGEGSCIGDSGACKNAVLIVGKNSCAGGGTGACLEANGIVGSDSCNGDGACENITGQVGCVACNGHDACTDADDVVIGDRSCWGDEACEDAGIYSASTVQIDNGSCIGEFACFNITANIGNDACKCRKCCQCAMMDVGDGECNSIGDINTAILILIMLVIKEIKDLIKASGPFLRESNELREVEYRASAIGTLRTTAET
jgi:hypothetical protein